MIATTVQIAEGHARPEARSGRGRRRLRRPRWRPGCGWPSSGCRAGCASRSPAGVTSVAGLGPGHGRAPRDTHPGGARRLGAGAAAEHDQDRGGTRGGRARHAGQDDDDDRRIVRVTLTPRDAGSPAAQPVAAHAPTWPRAARPVARRARRASGRSCACSSTCCGEAVTRVATRRAPSGRCTSATTGSTSRRSSSRSAGTWMQTVAQAWLVAATSPHRPSRRRPRDRDRPAVPAHAAVRDVGWAHRRPGRQAAAPLRHPELGRVPGPAAGRAHRCRRRATCGRCTCWPPCSAFVNLFDNPARQTFVLEMVGRTTCPNAVSLNSVVMNSARVIGPAIGGRPHRHGGPRPCASWSTPPRTWR